MPGIAYMSVSFFCLGILLVSVNAFAEPIVCEQPLADLSKPEQLTNAQKTLLKTWFHRLDGQWQGQAVEMICKKFGATQRQADLNLTGRNFGDNTLSLSGKFHRRKERVTKQQQIRLFARESLRVDADKPVGEVAIEALDANTIRFSRTWRVLIDRPTTATTNEANTETPNARSSTNNSGTSTQNTDQAETETTADSRKFSLPMAEITEFKLNQRKLKITREFYQLNRLIGAERWTVKR